ncbi:hypothetical protein BKA67DRAFT_312729 [Truncatella angustata]|uniref:Uncharacterized protein n=1 Tax=Truncatella angustata TaxID=152316 RepID=A0A9P8ZXR9_9PEZI|nr:uncharacterized protein BKA67DRAFT_312729 [Truncatella angustata]KAH6653254.1 hypothetical protein BKA67DRAFT_312729 [Truncatella angustata]KAH8194874.1 hypothetical protein TruAng_010954 [Truncatella angustata]
MWSLLIFALASTASAVFTIPEGQRDGVYEVSYDESDRGVHTFLRGPATDAELAKLPSRGLTGDLKAPISGRTLSRLKRSDTLDCAGYSLEHGSTDLAVAALGAQCDPSGTVGKKRDFYSISYTTVAYFCNFGKKETICRATEVTDSYGLVAKSCGNYTAGWRTLQDETRWVSVGFEDKDQKFCARGTED